MNLGGVFAVAGAEAAPKTGDLATIPAAGGAELSLRALSATEIARDLALLPGWTEKAGMISKTFTFSGFPEAVAFIVRISFPLEALNHHPEIRNVYGTVTVGFTTHDLGNQLGQLDFRAARIVEDVAARLPQKK